MPWHSIVIVANDRRFSNPVLVRSLAWVGDFSYSLYLVHWPLFALVRATGLSTDLAPGTSVLLIILSFVLALLLYRFVEEPLRRVPVEGRTLLMAAVAGSMVVFALAFVLGKTKPNALATSNLLKPVEGLGGKNCFRESGELFDGKCSQSTSPAILLWGDSYSAHLVPGIVATTSRPLAQASIGHCTPFANYAGVVTANEFEWTKGCLAFNASVIEYARRTPSLEVVILAGQYDRTLAAGSEYAIRKSPDGSVVRAPLGLKQTVEAQRETVAKLRSFGLRVVVVSPPPPSPFDIGLCWQRRVEHVPTIGIYRDCIIHKNNPARAEQQFDAMMAGFEQRAHVPVIRVEQAICRLGKCQSEFHGKPLFRDTGHLTEWGSIVVGKRFDLGPLAWRAAL